MERVSMKHETGAFAQTLLGAALVPLVVLGIGGTIYKIIEPEGWLTGLFGNGLPGGVAMLGTLAAIWILAWSARCLSTARQQGAAVDLVVYAFAAVGLVYAGEFWMRGSF